MKLVAVGLLWWLRWQRIHLQYGRKVNSLSRVQLFVTPWTVACTRILRPWDFLGKSTGVGCRCLLHKRHELCVNLQENQLSDPRFLLLEMEKLEFITHSIILACYY